MNPTSPKPRPPVGVKSPPGKVQHDAHGKGVLNWAAETARNIALSASQVLRKLDHRGLSLEDTAAPRGKTSGRSNQMPGGGTNPYDNRPVPKSRHAPRSSTVIKGAGAAAPAATARGAAGGKAMSGSSATTRASARARSSWWQRLFRRG